MERNRTRATERPASRRSSADVAWTLVDALWDAPVGICLFDEGGRIAQANPFALKLSRGTLDDIAGKRAGELGAGICAQTGEAVREVLGSGEPVLGRALVGAPDADAATEPTWVASFYPIAGETRPAGVCAVIEDASERVRSAQAAERARREAERSAERLRGLQAVTKRLSGALDALEVARIIDEEGLRLVGAEAGAVHWSEDGCLRLLHVFGRPSALTGRYAGSLPLHLAFPPAADAARTGEVVCLESPEEIDRRYPQLAELRRHVGAYAWAAIPLVVEGRSRGALSLRYGAPRSFPPEDRDLLLALADVCAQAIARARLWHEREALLAREREALAREREAVRALADAEDLFRATVRSFPHYFAMYDADLRYRFVSDSTLKMNRRPLEAFLGRRDEEIFPGEFTSRYVPLLRGARDTGEAQRAEIELPPAIGTGTILLSYVPVHDRSGLLCRIMGYAIDITERKRLEREMQHLLEENRAQKELLSATFDAMPAGVGVASRRDWTLRLANAEYRALTPHPETDPVGRPLDEIWPAQEGFSVSAALQARIERGETGKPIGTSWRHPDGSLHTYLLHLRDVEWRGEPALLAALVETTDLDRAREAAEDAAAQASRRAAETDALLASMAEGLVLLGPDGELRRMNDAARRLFGRDEATMPRCPKERQALYRLETPDGRVLQPAEFPSSRALRGEVVHDELLVLGGGPVGRKWLVASAAPIAVDGRATGVVTTFADVTQLHLLQEEHEDLLRAISHDLRTPLGTILGHARLLERDAGSSGRTRAILRSAVRMETMLRNLSEMARIEGGHLRPRLQRVDASSFTRELRERLRGTLDVDRIRIAAPAHGCAIHADPDQLERIVLNLVTNALKYSPEDSEVVVECRGEGDEVVLSVADHGEGIRSEDLPHVFDRFYRSAQAHDPEGLGLGLYITRRLVEGHGGRIEVESRVGGGSVFRVRLRAAGGG